MTAYLLRICDEDREEYGGPEWVRFDPADLDDIPWQRKYEWEVGDFNIPIGFFLVVDWPTRTARGKVGAVWLARTLAGIETPPMDKFNIKDTPSKLDIKVADETAPEPKGGDADPPVEPRRSSAAARSKK